jgi:hypothetical protein
MVPHVWASTFCDDVSSWLVYLGDHVIPGIPPITEPLIPDVSTELTASCKLQVASWVHLRYRPKHTFVETPFVRTSDSSYSSYRNVIRTMSPSTSLSISDHLRQELTDKLENYRHLSDDTPDQGTTNGHDSTDSEQVLSAILKSDKIASEEQVGQAVDEYIGGKPLAYITGENRSCYPFDGSQIPSTPWRLTAVASRHL